MPNVSVAVHRGAMFMAHIAYVTNGMLHQETIFVQFPDGIRWWYGGCDREVWEEFMDPITSKGRFIRDVLDHHQNGRYEG